MSNATLRRPDQLIVYPVARPAIPSPSSGPPPHLVEERPAEPRSFPPCPMVTSSPRRAGRRAFTESGAELRRPGPGEAKTTLLMRSDQAEDPCVTRRRPWPDFRQPSSPKYRGATTAKPKLCMTPGSADGAKSCRSQAAVQAYAGWARASFHVIVRGGARSWRPASAPPAWPSLDSTIVTVAAPRIVEDLGGGFSGMQWVLDGYLLTLGSLVLVGGALGTWWANGAFS